LVRRVCRGRLNTAVTTVEVAAFLADMDPQHFDELLFVLGENVDRRRTEPSPLREPEPLWVPVSSIWHWCLLDMIRCGYEPQLAAAVVAKCAVDDQMDAADVVDLIADALAEVAA